MVHVGKSGAVHMGVQVAWHQPEKAMECGPGPGKGEGGVRPEREGKERKRKKE